MTGSGDPPNRLMALVAKTMNCCADVPTSRSPRLTGIPSALRRDCKTCVNGSIGSAELYCRSVFLTLSNAASQCRLITFRGNNEAPGPPKLQLIARGKLDRSRAIRLTSARLRHGLL